MKKLAACLVVVSAPLACWSEQDENMNSARTDRARAAEVTDVVRGGPGEDASFYQQEGGSADRMVGVVRQTLIEDPALQEVSRDIEIGLNQGVLVLSGEVPYLADKQRVEQRVKQIARGYRVENRIEVGMRPGGGG